MASDLEQSKKPSRNMKKTFFSVGLAAVGAASGSALHAQNMEAGATPKMWNVAATLRGFYDDNYAVANNKKGSFGFEFTPTVSANVDLKKTDIGIRYAFGMYYYLQRDDAGIDPIDYTHQADLWLDHSFTERWKLNVTDSLAIAQDPALLQGGAPIRVNGDNVANRAKLNLHTDWTRQFSTSAFYGNSVYNYSDSGVTNTPANPSEGALLNRMEQNVGIDFQWTVNPETMVFVGYNYSWVRYDGSGEIHSPFDIYAFTPPSTYTFIRTAHYFSNSRDYNSHYGYLGVSHEFSPNLNAQARVGASYTDSFNDPISPSTSLAPYADISVNYTYNPGCYLQVGLTQNVNSTDVVEPNATTGHLTQYVQGTSLYFDINHRFTPKLSGSLVGQYQYSSYENGKFSGTGDSQASVGINLNYQINRHLSAEAGYNFEELISDIQSRGNDRNRVYLGLSANY